MIEQLQQDARVVAAATRVRDDREIDEVLARVAWNVIAEPGDGVAGALIGELGAVDALRIACGQHGGLVPPVARPRAFEEALARWRPRLSVRAVGDALLAANQVRAALLMPGDERWPESVDDLGAHAPVVLWVRGDASLLSAVPRVALVGARASSTYGDLVAAEFGGDLAASGVVIVSGAAYGIDGVAHRAALSVDGATIALLAGGVDRAYPLGHESLIREIAAKGAVVSEVPCGTAPTKWRFLSRNRLIAAIGDATVVIEAGSRSGSINTAGHAASLGRPLGAVPGPVNSATSAGCHRLMREYDARCVTTVTEVRELWESGVDTAEPGQIADPDITRLLDAMSSRIALAAQELARRSGLSQERVGSLLGLLELEGTVARVNGTWRRMAGSGDA
ncbi:MAG: DNA-processing protein DprA [Microbacterium sp.]